jgi:CBS-domain-containing membrane protein
MPTTTTNIHHITVIHGAAPTASISYAACPRRNTATALEDCLSCDRLVKLEGASTGNQHLVCATVAPNCASAAPGTVGALMSHDVVCIAPDVTFETVVGLLRQYRVGALPVVDDDGAPIGIVSKTDVIRVVGEGRVHSELDTFDVDHAAPPVRSARDLMTPIVVALRESDDVAIAASRLRRDKIHHAPVVGELGNIVGLLSTLDLLAALAVDRRHLED